jgi:sugar O-acyltransferase (sialic acid O-acetyltransferase NeuD family)
MRLVLIGGGGHASDVLGCIEAVNEALSYTRGREISVAGIVDQEEVDPRRFAHRGVHQIGDMSALKGIDASHYILCQGWGEPRRRVFEEINGFGLLPADPILHPRANLPRSLPVGAGTVILGGVNVSPMAQIGEHAYLSHGCMIGHDTVVGRFATVLPGAAVSGDVILGEACTIGTMAAVIEGVTIGDCATIGAGAVVLRDIPAGVTAVGVPAKVRT